MAIQTIYDTGDDYKVTPKMDGGLYGTALSDCVCKGISDEFALIQNGLTVTFSDGCQAAIGGSFFKIIGSIDPINIPANGTYYLCANINLAKENGSRGGFEVRASTEAIKKDNLNGTSGSERDLLLYEITTNANSITSVVDKRVIKGDGGAAIADLNMSNLNMVSSGAIPYTTTVPTSANTNNGLIIVYRSSKPATLYSGYLYLIKES